MSKSCKHIVRLMCLIIGLFSSRSQAQTEEIKVLPALINTETVLDGSYLINRNILVNENANLIIKEGSRLYFEPKTSIKILGGLQIKGSKKQRVYLTSYSSNEPGNGLIIGDLSNSDIEVDYAVFENLSKPLVFEKNWVRKSVSITHSVFRNSDVQGAVLEIQNYDPIRSNQKIAIQLRNNTFSNNSGSVFFSNISSPESQVVLKNNTFTRNHYTGRSINGLFTSPLFFNYNDYGDNPAPQLFNNAVFDNFSSLFLFDTVESQRINICAIGTAQTLDLSDNYLGSKENKEAEKTFDLISAQYKAPFIFYQKLQEVPSQLNNGHFYKVWLNEEILTGDEQVLKDISNLKTIRFKFNRPVYAGPDYAAELTFFENDTVYKIPLKTELYWSEEHSMVLLEIKDKIRSDKANSYITVDGFLDEDYNPVPAFSPSKKAFYQRNDIVYTVSNSFAKVPVRLISRIPPQIETSPSEDTIASLDEKNIREEAPRKYKWELGFFTGTPLYFGDLYQDNPAIGFNNVKPAAGLRLSYQLNGHFSFEARPNFMVIAGSDARETRIGQTRGTGYKRNLSFRTTIAELAILAHWDFIEVKTLKTWVPGIHSGFTGFYFQPMGEFEGNWYDLRNIGTEGQTINGKDDRYERFSYGIPVGVHLKRHLSENLKLTLSYTHTKLFTDYLDDVSTGTYPDAELLKAANPDIPDAAARLSNPAGLTGQRSVSGDYDGYAYWGITFTWKLKKLKPAL